MGVFNTVICKCPKCDTELEEQFKPGNMDTYSFPEDYLTMPMEYLNSMVFCPTCKKMFILRADISITNPRLEEFKVEEEDV